MTKGRYKRSHYNLNIVGLDGTPLLFNSATLSLLALDRNKATAIKEFIAHPDLELPTPEQAAWAEHLLAGGFLVPEERAEVDYFHRLETFRRQDPSHLVMYVFPTLACNAACPYCFIGRYPRTMDLPTEEALVRLVEERGGQARRLTAVWYGGEPLTKFDQLQRLSARLMAKAAAMSMSYDAGIYTNGYLLTRNVALALRDLGVQLVHVAVDGPREVHDRRRALSTGEPTYDTLLRNLTEIEGIFKTVLLRVHVDRETVPNMQRLFDDLHDLGFHHRKDVVIRFAPLEAMTPSSAGASGTVFAMQEYARVEIELAKAALLRGLMTVAYPFHRPVHCMSHLEHEFAVNPDGAIFQCLADVGRINKSVGALPGMAAPPNAEAMTSLFRSDSFINKENCRDCHIEPTCGGGCFHAGYRLYEGTRGYCPALKYNISHVLQLYHALLKRPGRGDDMEMLVGPLDPAGDAGEGWLFHDQWLSDRRIVESRA